MQKLLNGYQTEYEDRDEELCAECGGFREQKLTLAASDSGKYLLIINLKQKARVVVGNGSEDDEEEEHTELMLRNNGLLPDDTLSISVGEGDSKRIFKLVAAVVHLGDHRSGHYRSIFFEGEDTINYYDGSINGSWLRMSKEDCSKEIARNGYVFIYLSNDTSNA